MANGVNNKAFDLMTTAADKTSVDLFPPEKKEVSTKNIHHALMAAGMSPAYGNIADVADATLYALEGEFGEAAWSMAAAIPVIGQMVSGKRALKAAKEAGEEMITVYRGVDKWYPARVKKGGRIMDTGETMVKEGKFVGGGEYISKKTLGKDRWHGAMTSKNPDALWTSMHKGWVDNWVGKKHGRRILEFEVPWSYAEKHGVPGYNEDDITFALGLPKEFLKKVHK
jgi:hypothetical protein